MIIFTALQQALRGLLRNPARTALTTLGIVIGVATVIIVLSAGAGFSSLINAELESFGANSITVEVRVPPTTKQLNGSSGGEGGVQNVGSVIEAVTITTLKPRDAAAIKRIPNVVDAYSAVLGQKLSAYKNNTKNAFIFGAESSRFDIDSTRVEQGRPYTVQEDNAAAQVAVLGHGVASDLFENEDPIGKTIRIAELNFVVVGVYEEKSGLDLNSVDQQIFLPLNTAQKKLLGIDHVIFILATLSNNDIAEATAEDIRVLLRNNHGIKDPVKDDFLVNTQASNLSIFETILSGVTFLLIAVAAISLLVGGVGIMNIMYVVVTERISEIGLKKALGARSIAILLEFLIEAVLLTALGGIMGVALGAGISFAIAQFAQSAGFAWSFSVPISGIILGVGVSSAIGLIFGVFPARRASKLDPIEAMRHES